MAFNYEYSLATDFVVNHVINSDHFVEEVKADVDLAALFQSLDTVGDQVIVQFSEELGAGPEAALDAIVAAHDGSPLTKIAFRASATLTALPVAITEDQSWEEVGGIVTNVAFFIPNLAMALGRVVGQYKAVGTGAQIRIAKADSTVLLGPTSLADTNDVWSVLSETTSPGLPLETEEYQYSVQARLNGATSLSFRYVSFTLLEIYT